MTSQDAKQISNFFVTEDLLLDQESYESVEWPYLPDVNQGSYQSNIIEFNTQSMIQRFTVLSDSYLYIPYTVTSSGTAFTANSEVAFKQSALQLISGVSVSTPNTTIVSDNDNSVGVLNTILPLIDENIIDIYTLGADTSYFGLDRTTLIGGSEFQSIGQPTNFTGVTTSGTNSNGGTAVMNVGLKKRVSVFKQYLSSGFYRCHAHIPLCLIHNFFRKMDWPMVNMPLRINFNLAINNIVQPLTISANSDIQGVTPIISIGHQQTVDGFVSNTCRLHLKCIKFNGQASAHIGKALSQGISKTIEFTTSNLYSFLNYPVSTTSINQLVTSNSARPVRMFVLTAYNGAYASSTSLSPGIANSVRFSNLNISVNNSNWFQQNLQDQYEIYNLLKSEMIHADPNNTKMAKADGQINYRDFLSGYGVVAIDFKRLRLSDPNSPCSIGFSAIVDASKLPLPSGITSFDLYFVVERLNTFQLKLSSTDVISIVTAGQAK